MAKPSLKGIAKGFGKAARKVQPAVEIGGARVDIPVPKAGRRTPELPEARSGKPPRATSEDRPARRGGGRQEAGARSSRRANPGPPARRGR